MPKLYPAAFHRQALALLHEGLTVREDAASLATAESCFHHWQCQRRIEQGQMSGVSDAGRSE